jgi:hypothetical protein
MEGDSNVIVYNINMDDCSKRPVAIKFTRTNNNLYYVANYDKTQLNFNDKKTGEYRSVVFSFFNKKVISFSPPKSIPPSIFMHKYKNLHGLLITDAIEGVMITLFFDESLNKWEISTKGAVGGKYGYYGNVIKKGAENKLETPTFYRMFLDALRASSNEELNDLPFLEYLPRNASYTFILQHPKNNILLQLSEPVVYLVAVYLIHEKNVIEYVPQNEYENWQELDVINDIIRYPKIYTDIDSYAELTKKYTHGTNGIMVTNINTGERTKIVSKKYEQLKTSKAISPGSQYLYFCLRRVNKVTEYLDFFPKYKKVFYKIRNEYEEFITDIHQLYLDIYVHKRKPQDCLDRNYRWCKKIHEEIYLPSLSKLIRQYVTRKIIKGYFDRMEPRELLYIINHDFRQI